MFFCVGATNSTFSVIWCIWVNKHRVKKTKKQNTTKKPQKNKQTKNQKQTKRKVGQNPRAIHEGEGFLVSITVLELDLRSIIFTDIHEVCVTGKSHTPNQIIRLVFIPHCSASKV